jgi:hypothetical protein
MNLLLYFKAGGSDGQGEDIYEKTKGGFPVKI